MKLVSWNVNGIRAAVNKDFVGAFERLDADIFAIQESKLQEGQISLELPGYHQYWNYAKRKGYSGTAVFTKEEPHEVIYGMGLSQHDQEGRLITLDMGSYYFVTVYVPNSQNELKRLDYRMEWEDDFREYLNELKREKTVLVCGDLNVAHKEIDLKNPASNHMNPGFTDQERGKFDELLESDRFNSRSRNAGWRIDYFLVSSDAQNKILDAKIHSDVLGSDHCPVELDIEL